jgi:hypothetical protein
MEHCSRYGGINSQGCFGIVWVEEGAACWLRNRSVSTNLLTARAGYHTALVDKSEMNGFDTSCPAVDQSSTNTIPGVDGIQYTMHCNKVVSSTLINSTDTCFDGMTCLGTPFDYFYHTSTFEECLQICAEQHPLCSAISWIPVLQIGFANCWPRKRINDSSSIVESQDHGTTHSAIFTQFDPIDTKCPENNTYATENISATGNAVERKTFDIHCGKSNAGIRFTSLHTQNVTACMNACASAPKEQKCVGVEFYSSLESGFRNCGLLNTTTVVSDQPDASTTYAFLADTTLLTSDPNTSALSGFPSSKAWIAGPVIGCLAALAAIGFAVFWWRRKKAARSSRTEKGDHPLSSAGYHDGPGAASEVDAKGTAEMPAVQKPVEMPASTNHAPDYGQAHELPASTL